MRFLYIFLGILGMVLIWLIYDRVSWYVAKYEEAKNGTVIIAEYMRFLRECLLELNNPERKELEDIFMSIQLNNARSAYILGGIKLLDKVSKVRPTPVKKSVTPETDIPVKSEESDQKPSSKKRKKS